MLLMKTIDILCSTFITVRIYQFWIHSYLCVYTINQYECTRKADRIPYMYLFIVVVVSLCLLSVVGRRTK